MDKYLIYDLGNPDAKYAGTHHNTEFMVLDAFAKVFSIVFKNKRYGFVVEASLKGRKTILLKSVTSMSLSGDTVHYWLNRGNIDQRRLLVVSDDVTLPLGESRLKDSGSNSGHNGLGYVQQLIGQNYPRLCVGIGNEYPRGGQVDWVLGHYDETDMQVPQPTIDAAVEIVKSSILAGIDITMNQFNQQGKKKGGQ